MPKLSRIRLVSIGHPRARFEDIILDFRDNDGLATDSILWLRNGGGKSSLLNLFYSVVRPRQTEFLGGKGGEEHRRLTDYVLPRDRAVVACEWQLEGEDPLFNEGPMRYLTIVINEHRASSSEDGSGASLQRLFLSAEARDNIPELTLENLPLSTLSEDGRVMRRSLANFRREWRKLQEAHPHCDVYMTDKQQDWVRQIESRGIDTHLFKYQLDMNSREGGVTQLFSFSDSDSFVDFLLETAFDPEDAENVFRQIKIFRNELQRRHNQLLPDSELCKGLLERLAPFESIAIRRADVRQRIADYEAYRIRLASYLKSLRAGASSDQKNCQESLEECRSTADKQHKETQRLRRLSLRLRCHAFQIRLKDAEHEQAQRREEMEAASFQEDLWIAGVPLERALKYEKEANEFRERLKSRQASHAPLIEQLKDAATSFHAGLSSEIQRIDNKADEMRSEAQTKQGEAVHKQKQALDFATMAAEAATKADSIELRLVDAEEKWRRLIAEGIALEAETPAESVARLAKEMDDTNTHLCDEEIRESQAQKNREKLKDEQANLSLSLRQFENSLKEIDEQLANMSADQDSIARDETLLSLFQAESVNVDNKVCNEADRLAREEIRRLQETILDLRLKRAGDEWSIEYLRDHGRLPPSADVLAVLEWLNKQNITCWSGWEYLESNVLANLRREAISRQPHLASGIIVNKEDALETLKNSDSLPHLAGPVAVGLPQQLLDEATSQESLVLGPSDDSLFDASAAGRAEAEMSQRIERSKSEESELKKLQDELALLVEKLRRYNEAYPSGWLKSFQDKKARIQYDIAEAKTQNDNVRVEFEKVREDIQRITESIAALRKKEKDLTVAHQKALHFVENFGKHLESWKLERESLRGQERQYRTEQQERAQQAEQLADLAKDCNSRVEQLVVSASRLRDELDRVRHAEPGALTVSQKPLDDARNRYQALLEEYESKVGADTLEQLAAQKDFEAKKERDRFESARKPHVKEQAVVDAIRALTDITAEDAKHRAIERHWEAKGKLGHASQKINQTNERIKNLGYSPEDDEEGEDSAPPDLSAEDAEAEANRTDKQADVAQQEAEEAEKRAEHLKERMNELEKILIKIDNAIQNTGNAGEQYAELLREASETIEGDGGDSTDDHLASLEDCIGSVDRLAKGLADVSNLWMEINRESEKAAEKLREWCLNDRYTALPDGLAKRFSKFTAADIEQQLERIRESLRTRLEQIEADLSDSNKQRDIVVGAVMHAVNQAMNLLTQIARLSRLPKTVRGGGRPFLDIDTSAPDDPAERRARVAELVDEIIQSGDLQNGMELVQRATRRVTRPLRVRILHPDMDSFGKREPINRMANFSGGEKLTTAILLYCALARMRGQQLGVTGKRTSVLILDNPIGTVSRVRYLDLQREVAKALGVQLIYATGVHDTDAVASLPNIIRLRNTSRDVRRGHSVVELDQDNENEPRSVVDAVRVHISPMQNLDNASKEQHKSELQADNDE